MGRSCGGRAFFTERLIFPFPVDSTRTFTVCPSCTKVMYVVDKGVGYLRDMHQAGLPALQSDESTEFGDRSHLTFQNVPNLRLHIVCCFSFQMCLPHLPLMRPQKERCGRKRGTRVPRRPAPISCLHHKIRIHPDRPSPDPPGRSPPSSPACCPGRCLRPGRRSPDASASTWAASRPGPPGRTPPGPEVRSCQPMPASSNTNSTRVSSPAPARRFGVPFCFAMPATSFA